MKIARLLSMISVFLGSCVHCSTGSELLLIESPGKKFGLVDATGTVRVECKYDAITPYAWGYRLFEEDIGWRVLKREGWTTEALEFARNDQIPFPVDAEATLWCVCSDDLSSCEMVDLAGQFASSDDVEYNLAMNDGLLGARDKQSNLMGFVGRSGKWLIEPRFDKVGLFGKDRALFYSSKGDGGWGYIDKSGRVVVEPQYFFGDQFDEIGVVRVWDKNRSPTLINRIGKRLLSQDYRYIVGVTSNGFWAQENSKPESWAAYTLEEEKLFELDAVELVYDQPGEGWVVFKKGEDSNPRHLVYDDLRKLRVEFEGCTDVEVFGNERKFYGVIRGDKIGYVDEDSEWIWSRKRGGREDRFDWHLH